MKKITLIFTAFVFALSMVAPVTQAGVNPNGPGEPTAAATIKAGIENLKNLSRSEKRQKAREVKKAIKQYKADQKAGYAERPSQIVLVILAILIPPLAVYLHQGEINSKFWISLVLSLLFLLPGIIYSLLVVLGEA